MCQVARSELVALISPTSMDLQLFLSWQCLWLSLNSKANKLLAFPSSPVSRKSRHATIRHSLFNATIYNYNISKVVYKTMFDIEDVFLSSELFLF
jgi:hypothetical protein